MARPEADAGEYYEPYNKDAWKELASDDFTPWKPGDPPVRDERPSASATTGGYVGSGGLLRRESKTSSSSAPPSNSPTGDDSPRRGRWWTEEVPPTYKPGDRVTNTRTARGILFDHVQSGTKGHVDKVEKTVLGEDRITVRFDNGYTEVVSPEDIKPRSWWD